MQRSTSVLQKWILIDTKFSEARSSPMIMMKIRSEPQTDTTLTCDTERIHYDSRE